MVAEVVYAIPSPGDFDPKIGVINAKLSSSTRYSLYIRLGLF